MPSEDASSADTAAHETAVRAPEPPLAYDPVAETDWAEDEEELPRRPRRRPLAPVPLTLLAALLIACGFIGGVLVEKGQTSSGSGPAASGLASRFAALRSGSAATGSSGTSARSFSGAGGFGGFGGAGGATTGTVAYIVDGNTLYVTTSEGNTVKVSTSAGSSVTKTVKASVADIHPGETVVVTGATGKSGAVAAESIKIGSTAGGAGSLFGGGTGSSSKGTSSAAGGEQSLFGG